MAKRGSGVLQVYPRKTGDLISKKELFPKQDPPIPIDNLSEAIKNAFIRTGKNKKGEKLKIYKTPEQLTKLCIDHLKQRSDPILSPYFFSEMKVEDVFDMDAVAHEMQRQRMKIGVFYQYLMIELMREAQKTDKTNFINVFDGSREGDAVADIKTPGFKKGLRLYISIKKSSDTVGGQDIEGVIRRLEDVAKAEKNLTSPYLCVLAVATPQRGKKVSYNEGRKMRFTRGGHPYSMNCEVWMPGFIYPYITGLKAEVIYKQSIKLVKEYMPFYSLKVSKEATELLKQKFNKLGISDADGNIDSEKFFEFIIA